MDGYLLKEIDGDNLIKAIQDVAEGKSILNSVVTRRVMSRAQNPGSSAVPNKLDILSAQERRVVALVTEGKTNRKSAAKWGSAIRR